VHCDEGSPHRSVSTYSADMVHAVAINQTRPKLRSADTAQSQKPRCRTEIGKGVLIGPTLALSSGILCLRRSTALRIGNFLEGS
jgi:hypothetical protein